MIGPTLRSTIATIRKHAGKDLRVVPAQHRDTLRAAEALDGLSAYDASLAHVETMLPQYKQYAVADFVAAAYRVGATGRYRSRMVRP